MNYEEKYKQALERARIGLHDCNLLDCDDMTRRAAITTIYHLFPELAESDDERIRRGIIRNLQYLMDRSKGFVKDELSERIAWLEKQGESNSQTVLTLPKFTFNDVLALQCCMETVKKVQEDKELYEKLNDLHSKVYDSYQLEKQGEQTKERFTSKPSKEQIAALRWVLNNIPYNKYKEEINGLLDQIKDIPQKDFAPIEPKFEVGDWLQYRYAEPFLVEEITEQGYCNGDSCLPFEWEDEIHLWTIQDAKDGDILVNGSNIFIFHFINGTRLMGYCHVNMDDEIFYDDIGRNECFCLIDAIVTPATKEQRDLFFSKMKEDGYELDADKKELKKIEPKIINPDVLQELNKLKEEIKELKEEIKNLNNRRRWK